MSNEFETPAEREAKINAANARINEAIAEDVAVGMADKAAHERNRANAYADGNNHLRRENDAAQFQRIHAENQAVDARRDANNSKFGFWLLASFIAVALFVGTMWWSNSRTNDVATASSASQPPVVTRTIVVSPSPTPTVVRQIVPVPVPVVVPQQQPMRQAPAPAETPLGGYTQPVPRSLPDTAPEQNETPPSKMVPAQPESAPDTNNTSTDNGDKPLGGYIER